MKKMSHTYCMCMWRVSCTCCIVTTISVWILTFTQWMNERLKKIHLFMLTCRLFQCKKKLKRKSNLYVLYYKMLCTLKMYAKKFRFTTPHQSYNTTHNMSQRETWSCEDVGLMLQSTNRTPAKIRFALTL